MKTKITHKVMPWVVAAAALFVAACGANDSILRSGKESPTPAAIAAETTPIAKDIEAMHTANFTFIYVLRRKDGGKMDTEDRSIIRSNTAEANRRISAEDDRAFVVGSNYQLQSASLAALRDRFSFEDLSPAPAATPAANTGVGTAANTRK